MSPYAGTIVCPSCSAPAKKTAGCCSYCGAQIVLPTPQGTDAPAERRTFCARCGQLYASALGHCPRCPPSSNDRPAGRCPRCRRDCEPMRMGNASIDRCPGCGGHWFDGDEIEHAADLTTQGISQKEAVSRRAGLPVATEVEKVVRYLPCARCSEMMARRQVAPRAGIVVDICRHHGVWFDGGELEQFLAFARAGGLEVHRVDGVSKLEAKRKLHEENLRGPMYGRVPPLEAGPPLIEWNDGFRLAARVLRKFWF